MMMCFCCMRQSVCIEMIKPHEAIILFLVGYLLGVTNMPRGTPDYTQIETQTVRLEQGTVNLNVYEIGFSRYDGGGRVVWFDDFRSGLYRHDLTFDAPGVVPSLSFAENRMFGFSPSAKFDPVGSGGSSEMIASIMLPLSNRIGAEFGLFLPTNHGHMGVNLRFGRSAGSPFAFGLIYNANTNLIEIDTSGGFVTVFTPSVASQMDNRHIVIKLTFDTITGKYVSLLVGESFIDISAYTGSLSANYPPGSATYDFYAIGASAVLKEPVFLDYVVISADEP